MSRRTKASSKRTKPTEHYFYGSSVSRASANPHAPSVFVPTDDRVGQWATQVYPPPPSEESRVPSQFYDDTVPGPASQVYHAPAYAPTYPPASQGYNAPTYPSAFQAYNAPSYTPSYAPNHYYHTHVHWPQYAAMNYALYANWESQGLGYAQSNRAPYHYQQAAPAPARPARYFEDARGNQVNIERLKKEKKEADQVAEKLALRSAELRRQYEEEEAKAKAAPPPQKNAFQEFVKNFKENGPTACSSTCSWQC